MENHAKGGRGKNPHSSRTGNVSAPESASGQSQQVKSGQSANQNPDQPNADTLMNRGFFKRSGRKLL